MGRILTESVMPFLLRSGYQREKLRVGQQLNKQWRLLLIAIITTPEICVAEEGSAPHSELSLYSIQNIQCTKYIKHTRK